MKGFIWKHRLTNINLDLLLADCAECGPSVSVYVNHNRTNDIRCLTKSKDKPRTSRRYGNTRLKNEDRRIVEKKRMENYECHRSIRKQARGY